MTGDVEAWLRAVEGPERELAAAALAFVRESLTGSDETLKWNQPCWVVAGANCLYLSAQDGYVNLGFFEGAELADPCDLLEGTGKAMRHVKVRSIDRLEEPALADLVDAAASHART